MAKLIAFLYCPECGHATPERMPVDHSVIAHKCLFCGAVMRPSPGRCCVFCSHADLPCPLCQNENTCADPLNR